MKNDKTQRKFNFIKHTLIPHYPINVFKNYLSTYTNTISRKA